MPCQDKRCKCTMAQSMVGDGCRYCQPQEYIGRLHDIIEDMEAEAKEADELMSEMAEALDFYADDDSFDVAASVLAKYNTYMEGKQ